MALRLLYGGHTKWSTGRRAEGKQWGRGRGKGSCLPALMCSSLSEILIVAPATSQKSEQKTTHTHSAHTQCGHTHQWNINWITYFMQTAQTEKEKHTLCSRLNTASLLCYSPIPFSLSYPLSCPAFPSSLASTAPSFYLPFLAFVSLAQTTIVSKKFSMCPSVSTQAQRVYAMVSACDTLQIAGRFSDQKCKSQRVQNVFLVWLWRHFVGLPVAPCLVSLSLSLPFSLFVCVFIK